jgi:hypothetical protein
MGVGGSASHSDSALAPVPIGQKAEWAPKPVWTQRLQENPFTSAGDRTPTAMSSTILPELPRFLATVTGIRSSNCARSECETSKQLSYTEHWQLSGHETQTTGLPVLVTTQTIRSEDMHIIYDCCQFIYIHLQLHLQGYKRRGPSQNLFSMYCAYMIITIHVQPHINIMSVRGR